jgi:signal peptidase II
MSRARSVLLLTIVLVCIGCDHATKLAATTLLDPGSAGSAAAFAGVSIRFELAHNPGAFLSLGADLPPPLRAVALLGIVPLGLLILLVAVWRSGSRQRLPILALGLLTGGGLANWLDRVLNDGRVTDFVILGLGPLHTGIFNLADVAVVAGALLLLVGRPRCPQV